MLYDRRRELSEERRLVLKVAEYIHEHGWCQGRFALPDGRVCLLGALIALYKGGEDEEEIMRVQKLVQIEIGSIQIPKWNDRRGRTQEDVLKLLERVAWGNS